MGLTEYKKKRSFEETPEPTGGKAIGEKLQFVIQKHDASRLHYDFRLELKGVLKSWAVPKGPSLNPADKRLAMLVEDHPFDYKNFEGIIPEGNYGAGTVIIWDEGTYEPVEDVGEKSSQEKYLLKAFQNGSMKIRMHGKKLKGEFALVRTKGRGENSWLLIKHRDKYATEMDIREKDKSVVSGKTIERMATNKNANQWKSNRSSSSVKRAVRTPKKTTKRKGSGRRLKSKGEEENMDAKDILKDVSKKVKSKMPEDVKPMLATLVDKPFDEADWSYEVKWDGFRTLSYIHEGSVEIRSRNNKDFNKKFYPIYDQLKDWNINVVLDGEITVLNEKGVPDFNALQVWRSEADGQLVYYLFDILWLEGYDLTQVPLKERRAILEKILPDNDVLRLSENFTVTGTEFFELADKMGLEGIIAKRNNSLYTPNVRSREWLKIKTEKHQEAVIAGYTKNENTNKKFSALLLGVYENNELIFIGPVGTGFNAKMQTELLEKLKPLETKKCPFKEVPEYNKPSRFRPNPPKAAVVWVKPKLVAEVTYRASTNDGSMRHPSFKGLREDKEARDVVRENPVPIADVLAEEAEPTRKSILKAPRKQDRKTLLNPTDETQVRNVGGHDLKFTNLSKIFWPEEKTTKRDMLNYYYQVVPYMLPYMKDRPQTLNRFPNGIYGPSFYQKDVTGKVPSWINTYEYFSEGDDRQKNFLVCTDEASLLYIASLGCIEMNPWSSRTQAPDHPDWCIIDLDPDKKNTFDEVIEVAQVTKELLDAIGVESFCKTSGSTGLHVYIPLEAKYTYEESKEFARALVTWIQKQLPELTTIERKISERNGRMYLDFLQNRPQATVAAPYSLRPKPGASVSMPLHWEEVKKGLKIGDFNIRNAMERIKSEGDLFKGVLDKGINIEKALKKLGSLS
ncbi:DNA ligase D [Chryseolinea sp. H1M3-3]|uniref:DNA ligase D n=1 Tax=Chryseolinea sp. H1M3-3 TaxID=3034144 RepID=UPI0023EBF8D6|nr:DNA ligase D [Chryseolinea sp. H1M3-3]